MWRLTKGLKRYISRENRTWENCSGGRIRFRVSGKDASYFQYVYVIAIKHVRIKSYGIFAEETDAV
jgi:hypothetical protein